MKLRLFPLGLCLATGLTIAASAQVARKPAPAQAPAAPSAIASGNLRLRGETAIYDDNKSVARLVGNVRVAEIGQALILYADELTYDRTKNQAVAVGNLRIETRSSTIRGARIFADFDTKIISLTGSVTVTTHGKTDGINGNRQDLRAQFKSKPSKITCLRADWDYEDGQATLIGNIKMTQGTNSGTCERILYDEENNVARLLGKARFTDDKKRAFNSPEITVYIDRGTVVTKGGSFDIPRNAEAQATPRPLKPKVLTVPPAPSITDDQIKVFSLTPPPIPTPRPEATEAPAATPRPEPEEETPDAPEAPAAPARKR